MTTFRVQHNKSNPYAIIDKGFLDNPNLTAKAKGIFSYLLSKPDNWRVHLNHLVTVFQDGHTSLRSGLKELQQAGYLVRAAIRNELGQIVEWVVNLYEAPYQPSYPTDKNNNLIVQGKTKISDEELDDNHDVSNSHTNHTDPRITSTIQLKSRIAETLTVKASFPDVGFPHLGHPCMGNQTLINNEYKQLKKSNNISPSEREEIFGLESDSICGSQVNFESNKLERDSLAEPTDYLEQESTSAISNKVEITSRTEVVKPTNRARTAFNSWIPDGAWNIDGKLDPNFVLWLATDWQKAYGGEISKKKADVLRYFKKDPSNIAISWEQYRDEQHSRYSNAAIRMNNGLDIKPDEQEKLLKHSRALTEDFPDDIRPVADVPETGRQEKSFSLISDRQIKPLNQTHSNPIEPTQNNPEITNSPNLLENDPQTSKLKEIDRELDDAVNVSSSIKNWAKGAFSMGKSKSVEREKPSELDELNAWLSDPILREEVMPRVINSSNYTFELNEYGEPFRVVEIKGD